MMNGGSAVSRWAVVGLFCVGGLSCAKEQPGLTLELRADKTRYLLEEPLFVTVVFDNRGREDAPLIAVPVPFYVMHLEITVPGGEPRRYSAPGDVAPERFAKPDTWVRPGGQYSITFGLTSGWARLSQPGRYTIRAHYATLEQWEGEPLELWSKPLRLVVEEPKGVDRRAYAVFRKGADATDDKIWKFWGSGAERKEYYEQVLREYPESGYAVYARRYLGGVYWADAMIRRDRPGARERKEALERSAALRLEVAKEAGDTVLGVSAALGAGHALATAGETAQAQAALEMAFMSPAATDGDRDRAVWLLRDVETGYLHHASGLAAKQIRTPVSLPLGRFAKALGLLVARDPETKAVTVTGPKVTAVLQPGEEKMVVNGTEVSEVRVAAKDGQVLVSPSVVRALMAAQLGRDPTKRW